MYQNDPCRVLTCECRLSYVNLVNPRAFGATNDPNAEPKYGLTLLIPKTETACIADINSAIQAAADAGLNKVFGGYMPQFDSLLHDGDGARRDGTPYGEECKGCWVLAASSKNKPQVVHQSNIQTELAPSDIYSGMYARVTLRFYPYANRSKGVGCGLGNVMKTRDGDPLGGGTTAANDFAGLETAPAPVGMPSGMPATGAPMNMPPQQGYAPQATQPYGGVPGQQVNPLTGLPF